MGAPWGPILVAYGPPHGVCTLCRPWGSPGAMAALDADRRALLLRAKLAGLVRGQWGDVVDRATHIPMPGGAALLADQTLWVLAEEAPGRSLGGALVLAARRKVRHLHLLAGQSTGTLARRAEAIQWPTSVWRVDGTSLVEAEAERLRGEPGLPAQAEAWRPVIEEAGAEAIVEAGVLRAEVRGLEVARVEVDDAGAQLAVGVGKHDREAKRMVHGADQGADRLVDVVRFVSTRRVADGEGPAYRLAPERWLRWLVVRRPDLVGAARLAPVPSPVRREDLRQPAPAPAAGVDQAGDPILVVCSVGVDMDLIPSAVDAWLADPRRPRLLLCVPEGDDLPAVRQLAALLTPAADLRTVDASWRSIPVPAGSSAL